MVHLRAFPKFLGAAVTALSALLSACTTESSEPQGEAIEIGALLPFTGKEASIGRNLEQALILAAEDVNRAGGIDGKPIRIISRDSNSGSERGFQELLQLLYTDGVKYLIGPEENELVTSIVPDVKGLDVLNVLPAYTAPPIERISRQGAWVRLTPSLSSLGCGMARHLIADAVESANAIVSLDDFNGNLASDFQGQFVRLGGESLPSVSVPAGASSYIRRINQALSYAAERTVLIAYPATAATIATEWTITGRRGSWYLSPTLRADVFLRNVPFGALDGSHGLSPSLSTVGECEANVENTRISCSRANADAFADHFSRRWSGDHPFPAAHYYYDAVVLTALGLKHALAVDGQLPSTARLHSAIRALGSAEREPVYWHGLADGLGAIEQGAELRYIGAAAEYRFDQYGAAEHVIFDTWSIANDSFVDGGSLKADCPRTF